MKYDDICGAIDSFYKVTTDDEFDSCDAAETAALFKKAIKDYSKILKSCENEGLSVFSEIEEFEEEFSSSSSLSSKLNLIASIQDNIRSMIDVCSNPPKDIINKYSEDLVSRIENGVIDDNFYNDD